MQPREGQPAAGQRPIACTIRIVTIAFVLAEKGDEGNRQAGEVQSANRAGHAAARCW